MEYQATFKRYEIKYLISKEQKSKILQLIEPYMSIDKYGKTTIRNIYFDTDDYRLIRHSIEKPIYKEKLRIRSYCQVNPNSLVFVELKKKYKSIVYKRRLSLKEKDAIDWICKNSFIPEESQIFNEINYFKEYYKNLHPTLFISYEREAYYSHDKSDFRITFDSNILCRQNDLSLEAEVYGDPILEDDKIIMEIKCSMGIPLWMSKILSSEKIFKTSFSKYGTAYKKFYLNLKNDKILNEKEIFSYVNNI